MLPNEQGKGGKCLLDESSYDDVQRDGAKRC